MTTTFEVPTAPAPQTFLIPLNGTTYRVTLTWCDPNDAWTMDIYDDSGNLVLGGTPLVTGADLLAQFAYLGIGNGGAFVVQSDNDPDEVPSFSTLGGTGHLFFVSPNP